MVAQYYKEYMKGTADPLKPFVGAKPKFLKEPKIATARESEAVTRLACATITQQIRDAPGVLLVLAQDASYSPVCRKLIDVADDSEKAAAAPTAVVLSNDWLHTLPHTSGIAVPPSLARDRLLIFVGTSSISVAMCVKSKLLDELETAYEACRLVVLTKGAIMLPLGSQEQNLFGADPEQVLQAIFAAVEARGDVAWGIGVGTKRALLEHAFHHLPKTSQWHVPMGSSALPPPMLPTTDVSKELTPGGFDSFAEYIMFANRLKLAKPSLPVLNYFDAGLTVSVVQGFAVEAGAGLLTDRDGLGMCREGSIGHTMSKLYQLTQVEQFASRRGVYNFFIGDGAARLNGGMEMAFHVLEDFHASSFVTLFLFNNHKWAIEDNLVGQAEKEHKLHNADFFDNLAKHPQVTMTNTLEELHATLADLSVQQNAYAVGEVDAQMKIVVVRGLDIELPVMLGDIEPIRKSPEMALMRQTLGAFAAGCESRVPVYGCSAFEYIQYLQIFLDEMPEGKHFQYTCGRTDIQAAHMCGFEQPEGKCVLFINDVYGINSLGESLRMVQSGLGGKQLLIFLWHPSLVKLSDHFHFHRPPMVWPSIGPSLAKFYVRKESDALFVDFDGENPDETARQVDAAVQKQTPLIVVNMLPEHERGYVELDIRAKVPGS